MVVGHFPAVHYPPHIRNRQAALHKWENHLHRRRCLQRIPLHIIRQKLAVCPRVCYQFLFIKALGVIQSLLGSEAKQTVCISLEGCQVIQLRRIHRLFFLFDRHNKSLPFLASSHDLFCLILFINPSCHSIQPAAQEMHHKITLLLKI